MIPSLEGWPTKAKEAPSSHEVRMSPLDTNPVFQSLTLISYLYQPSDNIAVWSPFLYPSKKVSLPLQFGQEENISGNAILKESLLIYFENWQGAPYCHRQSRNRIMNTFIIINIVSNVGKR